MIFYDQHGREWYVSAGSGSRLPHNHNKYPGAPFHIKFINVTTGRWFTRLTTDVNEFVLANAEAYFKKHHPPTTIILISDNAEAHSPELTPGIPLRFPAETLLEALEEMHAFGMPPQLQVLETT